MPPRLAASLLFLACLLPSLAGAACSTGAYGPGNGDFVVLAPASWIPAPGQRYRLDRGQPVPEESA